MKTWKKRLALYLAVLLVLPAVIGMLPTASQEVQAASTSLWWTGGKQTNKTTSIQVEAGQRLYLGDYIAVSGTNYGHYITASMLKNVTYTSSKPAVASVSKKTGYVNVKKAGKTVIKVKYGKTTLKCNLTVVAKKKLKSTTTYKKVNTAAKTLSKAVPTKITYSNALKILQAMSKYNEVKNSESTLSYGGFMYSISSTGQYTTTNKLSVPLAGRYETLSCMLAQYLGKYNCSPLSTWSAIHFDASKFAVSVKNNNATVTLKKAVTAQQIVYLQQQTVLYGSYFLNMVGVKTTSKATAYFVSWDIKNVKTGEIYTCIGTAKKGSKTITFKLYRYDYSSAKYVRVKIKKGEKFQLCTVANSWGRAKKATAK